MICFLSNHHALVLTQRRMLLFAQAIGLTSYGVENDPIKASKAYRACQIAYSMFREKVGWLTKNMEETVIVYETATIESLQPDTMPPNASIFYSFWHGIQAETKLEMGRLAKMCPRFRLLCVVQLGGQDIVKEVHEFGFPPMKLECNFPVKAAGSHQKNTCYILSKV